MSDPEELCWSCGEPGEVNCDSCLEVICLECVDTHEPKCRETLGEAERQKPIRRAEQAEQMAHELAAKLVLVTKYVEDQGVAVPSTPELVKYARLYHPDGKPRP